MNQPMRKDQEGPFTQPTPDRLKNLTTGCFVRVRNPQGCYWVELDNVEGDVCEGAVHKELASPTCKMQEGASIGSVAHFTKAQIVDLGCDRYCFC